jgi:hypothetical protein
VSIQQLKAGHQEQVNNFEYAAVRDDRSATRLVNGEQLRMRHIERAAVCQVNTKRLKRLGAVQMSELINRHASAA